ncbi:MAG: DUF1648 domain-containing protein [Brevibacterium sp.]|nr:DUF1648 domain-containing protein [Brevibacterium sp.]MDN5910461.1 DUF1648 domain-containing protein [Brevibacterium sp.]MDN6123580.1 DUF1648 domain-containing protein [Brevibacterium sp.]MDN6174602.1 DUF1648 domain-containing protein [Brevibacterium sp.]MDN6188242.1 DUF1648 domain-containing protein [Brevibacterium sp.]
MPSSTVPRPNRRPGSAALLFAVLSILVFISSAAWLWIQAPDQVPGHFKARGQPDDWTSKAVALAVLIPVGVGVPLLLSIRWIWEKLPMSLVNIPHKDYWLERGERGYLFACLMEFLRITAGATALLLTSSLVMTLRVGATMPEALTFVPTLVFLAIVGAALWLLYRQLTPLD